MSERLARGVPVIVGVGVTRAFAAREGEPALPLAAGSIICTSKTIPRGAGLRPAIDRFQSGHVFRATGHAGFESRRCRPGGPLHMRHSGLDLISGRLSHC